MIQNKELYSFDPELDPVSVSTPNPDSDSDPNSTSTTEQSELFAAEDSDFHFFNNLLYQTIVAICFLIMTLVISHSGLSWMNWACNRLHSAIETSQQETFGRISQSQLWKELIGNMSNLVRLEEITKKFEQPSSPKNIFTNSVWPIQGSITKGYGWQYDSDRKNRTFNSGIEITALPDTLVFAIADGTVSEVNHQAGRGWQLIINHGNGWSSSYNYLGLVKVKVGQTVKAGDTIAQISRPDQERGSILWFEIQEYDRPVDPLSVLAV
ncbi:MAG TPA: hypothetical protein DDW65_05595 [Firmicutes bacterium]|jgi:murein DD-endopeptidase MepM/ murein hydrolase activator NlpD|nr:hypothetical protein [Bacillota bacterium]